MKTLIENAVEVFFVILIATTFFLGDGTVSYKTVGTTYQTTVVNTLNTKLGPTILP